MAPTDLERSETDDVEGAGAAPGVAATIVVCATCRDRADPAAPPPGPALSAALAKAAPDLAVRTVRCLGNCSRALSAAILAPGAWTYVFGDLDPILDRTALADGARLLAASADGTMPWRGRPEPLKRGLVARVPPLGATHAAEPAAHLQDGSAEPAAPALPEPA